MKFFNILFTAVFTFAYQGFAQTSDVDSSQDAIQKVQSCLKSQNCETMNTAQGKAADSRALATVNNDPGRKAELYNMSSDIFANVMKDAGNDPAKAMELLQKAQSNPEEFLNSLSPEQKAKISDMAKQIEKEKNTRP